MYNRLIVFLDVIVILGELNNLKWFINIFIRIWLNILISVVNVVFIWGIKIMLVVIKVMLSILLVK